MITQELYGKIISALSDRADWETRQSDWYKLRYTGYGRPTLPYPNAPDMHYPLVDIEIEKLKPYYIQQIYAEERLATFINKKIGQNIAVSQSNDAVADNELKFDSELKQNSNFEEASHVFVDKALHYGKVIVKEMWLGGEDGQLCFVPINATHVIVPTHTSCIQDAPWFVHIIRLSVAQYRRSDKYIQNDDLIAKISGNGDASGTKQNEQDIKDFREGITGSKNDDSIILWEVYWKPNPTDKQWTITTVSPAAGIETKVRIQDDFKLAYNIGSFSGDQELPFDEITYEAPTEGFYSSRGLAEILEPFELALSKNWTYQLQFLDFNGQPTFFLNDPMANAINFSNEPGSIRPFGIERDAPLNAPLDLMQQMELTRALAEDRVQMPDLGNSQHLTGKEGTKGEVTATQIRAIVGLSQQSNDLRSRILKKQLSTIFRHSWDIIRQYRKISSPDVEIVPSGTADSWNKENRTQKMIAMFQLLSGRPNVDQDELLKMLLEQDNPDNVQRLYRDSGEQAKSEQEKEAQAIALMMIGFLPEVRPDENAAVRLETLGEFAMRSIQTGKPMPMTPELAAMVLQRGAQHEQLLSQQKNPQLQQLSQQFAPVAAQLQQIAAAAQPSAPQMPSGQMPQGQAPQGGREQKPVSESISWKPSDLTADEREQALAKIGIQATKGFVNVLPQKTNAPTSQP